MSEVILFSSDEVGAPAMTATVAGGMIAVLDACLVNGFNAKTPTQIVVVGGVATATVSAHGYRKGRKVLHAGSTTSALNGVKLILSTPTGNTYTFDATGVADGTYTGSLTAKRAPLGWVKAFGDSTHAMYARTDSTATGQMLRVDDTATSAVRVLGVESATDVNTYTGAFPTDAQAAGGGHWARRANYPADPIPWFLVGDGLSFYIFVPNPNEGPASGYVTGGFGDLISLKAGDLYHSFLGSMEQDDTNSYFLAGGSGASVNGVGAGGGRVCRDNSSLTPSVPISGMNHGNGYIGYSNMPLFPSPVDGGLVISDRVPVVELNTIQNCPIRGFYPGIAEPLAYLPLGVSGSVLSGIAGSSRQYLALTIRAGGNNGAHVLVDVTGPWQ